MWKRESRPHFSAISSSSSNFSIKTAVHNTKPIVILFIFWPIVSWGTRELLIQLYYNIPIVIESGNDLNDCSGNLKRQFDSSGILQSREPLHAVRITRLFVKKDSYSTSQATKKGILSIWKPNPNLGQIQGEIDGSEPSHVDCNGRYKYLARGYLNQGIAL